MTSVSRDDDTTAPAPIWVRIWSIAYLLLAIVALFWAGNAIVGRAARDSVPPFTLAFVRWAGALVLMAPFAVPRLKADLPMLKRRWKVTLMLGLVGVGAFNALLYSGLQYTTATNGVLIQALVPPFILIFSFTLFGERFTPMSLAAALVSVIGVAIIVLHGDLAELQALQLGKGDLMVLMGVIAWSLYTVLLRWRPAVHPLSFLAATFLVGALAMLPLSVMEHWQGRSVHWGAGAVLAFAYVATLPSLAAYLLYNRGVELIGAARAGQFLNLMPLFGAGLAVLLLGEPFGVHHFVGIILILLGIAGFSRRTIAPPPTR